jgi:hypothetical protein
MGRNQKLKDELMKWHMDAGHSWLEVKKSMLEKLGIAHMISGYSYEKGDKAYLEEDVDTAVFFKAYFGQNWCIRNEVNEKIKQIPIKAYATRAATCRKYDHYQAKKG